MGPSELRASSSRNTHGIAPVQVEKGSALSDIKVNGRIIDCHKSTEATKIIIEHIQRGNRKVAIKAAGEGKARADRSINDLLPMISRMREGSDPGG